MNVNTKDGSLVPPVKKVRIHPPNATRILLPDGRHMAYLEQGVPADRARFSIISPHSFLSSRLAGEYIISHCKICKVKAETMELLFMPLARKNIVY